MTLKDIFKKKPPNAKVKKPSWWKLIRTFENTIDYEEPKKETHKG